MELDVSIDKDSISITISNPFRLDVDAIAEKIEGFVSSKGFKLNGFDIKGLLPKMVRGIAGCEGGCPANALELVSSGFKNFNLAYKEEYLQQRPRWRMEKSLTSKCFRIFRLSNGFL
jgi:hypothetical protein